jgi:hypothetical protein
MVAALTIYYKEAHRTTIPFSLGSTFIKEAHRTTIPFSLGSTFIKEAHRTTIPFSLGSTFIRKPTGQQSHLTRYMDSGLSRGRRAAGYKQGLVSCLTPGFPWDMEPIP